MNSERYNERLNQIREKYGRANAKNPENELRQVSQKRDTTPLHQTQMNKFRNNYDYTPKPSRKQGGNTYQITQREKQNCSTSPLSLIKNQSPLGRNNRQKQINQAQENLNKYNNSQRPSISDHFNRLDFSTQLPRPSVEYSSPIKKLQFELETQKASKPEYNVPERNTASPFKPSINNGFRNPHSTDRSPALRPYPTPQIKQYERTSQRPPGNLSKNEVPKSNLKRQAPTHTNQINNFDESQGNKPVFNINSINKIQERIQWALNMGKK